VAEVQEYVEAFELDQTSVEVQGAKRVKRNAISATSQTAGRQNIRLPNENRRTNDLNSDYDILTHRERITRPSWQISRELRQAIRVIIIIQIQVVTLKSIN
jgi:hypothetical protein